jgi:DNA-binding transcriptional MocR family regulator
MLAALDAKLPECETSRPDGGYFVWLTADGIDSGELLQRAEQTGVTFVKGTDFGGDPDSLRLAYSFVSTAEIAEGVDRLASALLASPATA